MKKIIVLIVLLFSLTACSSADEAQRVLRQQGYTEIETTGYAFFGCAESDRFRTGFVATAPNGERVTGVVCSGFFKGATVRFD